MQRRRSLLLVFAALGLTGCGAETPPATTSAALDDDPSASVLVEPGDRAGADRASLEAENEGASRGTGEAPSGSTEASRASTDAPRGSTGAGASAAVSRPLLRLVRVERTQAEDGLGGTLPDAAAIAFDVDAQRVPPRALDPVLLVGALSLYHYTHPRIGTLRFVIAEEALPSDRAPIAVQYGQDASSRLALGTLSRASIAEAP
jgi:hypothetical protein